MLKNNDRVDNEILKLLSTLNIYPQQVSEKLKMKPLKSFEDIFKKYLSYRTSMRISNDEYKKEFDTTSDEIYCEKLYNTLLFLTDEEIEEYRVPQPSKFIWLPSKNKFYIDIFYDYAILDSDLNPTIFRYHTEYQNEEIDNELKSICNKINLLYSSFKKDISNYSFKEEYISRKHIDSYYYKIDMLCKNVPYEIYNLINIPEYIITYDNDSKSILFDNKTIEYFLDLLSDVLENGFKEPINILIRDGIVKSISPYNYLRLFIAKLLRIEYIPVCIYITYGFGIVIIPNRIDDVIMQYDNKFDCVQLSNNEIEFFYKINEFTNPYFYFLNRQLSDDFYTVGNDKSQYRKTVDNKELEKVNQYTISKVIL